ncbi:MAG: cobalamin-dependent protein [Peptococcaceae bacterium]|nr:cobalamin-dependent protein [Peptococcaceae bacterium]
MLRVCLIEPKYKTKYPPIGLMKISTYFKNKGFQVDFFKGCPEVNLFNREMYDIVCVTTLFTFQWDVTIRTIIQAKGLAKKIYVGGIMASIMPDDVFAEAGVMPVVGLLDKPGMLGFDDGVIVDRLPLDYTMTDTKGTAYATTTRGCIKKCPFCVVHKIEPEYCGYTGVAIPSAKNLVLLDNNVLASERFDDIARDISKAGVKTVDFNQGIDYKLATKENMKTLKEIGVSVVRFSIDDARSFDTYRRAVDMAVESGHRHFVTTMLYNFMDKPSELYEKMRLNVDLGEQYGVTMCSFPMKYIPVTDKDRNHIGEHWNKKFIRSIQGMLCSARGMVSGKRDFFESMWGEDVGEFLDNLWMPMDFLVYRRKYSARHRERFPSWKRYHGESDMIPEFLSEYHNLSDTKRSVLHSLVANIDYKDTGDKTIDKMLAYYRLNTPSTDIPWSKSYKGEPCLKHA